MNTLARLNDEVTRDAPALYIIFRVADAEYMLPADIVLQMESFSGATVVPGAPSFVAGLVQIRGRVVPVVDLRVRFGAPVGELVLDNRVVVGQHGDRVVGLLVDSAREVLAVKATDLAPPPPILALQSSGFIKAVAKIGKRLVMLIDFAKVIGEENLDGIA